MRVVRCETQIRTAQRLHKRRIVNVAKLIFATLGHRHAHHGCSVGVIDLSRSRS